MQIKKCSYIKSAPTIQDAPSMEGKMEFAFIGRSNVGKSSLINSLVQKKNLAHTSNRPGKTNYLNYYLINDNIYWVDLPGYGYAQKAKSDRKLWNKNMYEYLEKRENLACVFLLIDGSISTQKNDIEMLSWLHEHKLNIAIVFTKTDRENQHIVSQNIHSFFEKLTFLSSEIEILYFKTSSKKHTGREEMLKAMSDWQETVL